MVKDREDYGLEFEKRRVERNRSEEELRKEEVKSMVTTKEKVSLGELVSRYIDESTKRQAREEEIMKKFVENTRASLKAHDIGIKNLEKKVKECTQAIKDCLSQQNDKVDEEIVNVVTIGETRETTSKPSTFSEKVKRRIFEEQLLLDDLGTLPVNLPIINSIKNNSKEVRFMQELIKKKDSLEKNASVKLNARCSAVLRNEFPPKERDPGSFTLPCLIGKLEISNVLADSGASISIMPYSMFLCVGVGSLRPFIMDIEMADKSMQSPKGIVENV